MTHPRRKHSNRWTAGLCVALLLLSCLAFAPAAIGEESFRPGRIVRIASDELPGADAVEISGLAVGQQLTRARARDAVRALWNTGRVSDVRIVSRPAPRGVVVNIRLRLNQNIRELRIEHTVDGRERALKRQDIARTIGYYAGMNWQPEELNTMTKSLRQTYERRGYPDAIIQGSIEPIPEDLENVALKLTITEGSPTKISAVELRGELGLDEHDLLKEFRVKQGHVYDRDKVDDGIGRVLKHYRTKGYYDARIDAEKVQPIITFGKQGQRRARLIIPVEPGNRYRLKFVGRRWMRDAQHEEILAIHEEVELTRAILDTLADRLADRYRRLGFHFARVDWRVRPLDEPGLRELTFRIRAGPRVRVTNILFHGNNNFDDRHLRRQVLAQLQETLGETGVFREVSDDVVSDVGVAGEGHESWRRAPRGRPTIRVRPREVYLEEAYLQASRHIVKLYQADGFLDARLSEPDLEFSDEHRYLEVTIDVTEGTQTMIDAIAFEGNAELTDDEIGRAIRAEDGIVSGAPFDRYEVEQARRRIVRAYRSKGYMYALVRTADDDISSDRRRANVHYHITEGPHVTVGRIRILGNDISRRELILDRIPLRPGEEYNPEVVNASERALIDLGIFTTVAISLAEPEEVADIKDVIIEVGERRQQALEGRIGFSTADGPRGGLRYSYSNLGGLAFSLEMQLRLSYQVFFLGTPEFEQYVTDLELANRLERLVVLSFNAKHLPRIGRFLSLRLDATHERDNDPAYAVTNYGMTLSLVGTFHPKLNTQLSTGFLFSDIEQVQDLPSCFSDQFDPDHEDYGGEPRREGVNCLRETPGRRQLARAPQGSSWFWVTRLALSLDLRNHPFNPTRGLFASLSAEHVYSLQPVIGTDEADNRIEYSSNLIKFRALTTGYIPLGYPGLVLALSARFGWVFKLERDSHTFPDRFFYLGGFDSMRGFPEESLFAEDVDEPGGNSMLNLRAELRIPLPGSFALGVFFDTGNVWRVQTNLWNDFDLRMCVGAGIRYITPIGPLALDVGFVADRREDKNEDFAAVHFAIGLF